MALRFAAIGLCVLLLMTQDLKAEGGTCPPGYYPVNSPGVMGCAPLPDSGAGESANRPSTPGPKWKTQWVSIAFGKDGLGTAANMPSKRKAEKAALAQCRKMGGTDCHINLSTYNQCVAVVGGGHTALTAGDSDKSTAESMAMKLCNNDPKNSSCELYYSACSYAVRIR